MKKKIMILAATLCGMMGVANAQIKVANGGNVGIGLGGATPTQKLEVSGNVKFNNGNVGIGLGTSTPAEKLHVNGNVRLDNFVTIGGLLINSLEVLRVKGKSSFWEEITIENPRVTFFGATTPAWKITFDWSEPIIASNVNNYGCLGTESSRLFKIYASYYYAYTASGFQILSDESVKTNIQKISSEKTSALEKLKKVNVYRFDYSDKIYGNMASVNENIENLAGKDTSLLAIENENKFKAEAEKKRLDLIEKGKNQTGVMAQELKEIYPELVFQSEESGLYSVSYVGLIPHILLAVQEQSQATEKQNELIQSQNKEIESLKSQLAFMQLNCCNSFVIDPKPIIKSSNQTTPQTQVENSATARLDQNVPNPFTENTKISFFVPKPAQTAQLCVYDLTGKQLKQLTIAERGETFVSIQGQELQAGIYLYALLVDGQLVDSKRMVLTK